VKKGVRESEKGSIYKSLNPPRVEIKSGGKREGTMKKVSVQNGLYITGTKKGERIGSHPCDPSSLRENRQKLKARGLQGLTVLKCSKDQGWNKALGKWQR